jgi:hypothetical protein
VRWSHPYRRSADLTADLAGGLFGGQVALSENSLLTVAGERTAAYAGVPVVGLAGFEPATS